MMTTINDLVVKAAEEYGPLKTQLETLEKNLAAVTSQYESAADDAESETALDLMQQLHEDKEALIGQVEKAKKKLDILRAREQDQAAKAQPVVPAAVNILSRMHRDPGADYRPGDFFVKTAIVKALAYITQTPEEVILAQRYGADDAVKAVYDWSKKAAVYQADTTTVGWAAELVRTDMRGFLDMLRSTSVGAAIASRSMMLDFGGAAQITIPRINNLDPASMTEPAWVGEAGHIPLQQFSFGSATIARYKLASIVPMTMELAELSTPQAETVFRSAMEEAYALMLDKALLSNAAAKAGIRPAGLLAGVTTPATGQIAPSAGTGYAAVVADVSAMLAFMSANGVGARPVLVLNDADFIGLGALISPLGQLMFRDELSGGRLLGVEVVHSRNVPAGTAIMVDAAALATAFDGPRFMVSQEATLTMANAGPAAPTQAGTDRAPGAIGTAGEVPPDSGIPVAGGTGASVGAAATLAVAYNMFQTYSQAIRGVWPTSWAKLRNNVVATVVTTQWSK